MNGKLKFHKKLKNQNVLSDDDDDDTRQMSQ